MVGEFFEPVIGALGNRHLGDVLWISLLPQQMFEKDIAWPRLATVRVQLVMILAQDVPLIIDHRDASPAKAVDRLDAGDHALLRDIVMIVIRHQQHIGIDHGSLHAPASCAFFFSLRFFAAASARWVMSSMSSPKKSSGQFSMS